MADAAAQTPVIFAAWSFLLPFYARKDLAAAWPHADPTLRLSWAQWWSDANRTPLQAIGYDLHQVAIALADGEVQHPLWPDFERVVIRDFQAAHSLDPQHAAIGATPRVVAPDV